MLYLSVIQITKEKGNTRIIRDTSITSINEVICDILFHRCANGFIGQRCEFKDLDGSYLRK